jgi:hypothetical protein
MLIVLVGSIMAIATLCVASGVWAVMEATKGLKVGALPAVLTGLPGASLLAFLASRIMRWFKKPRKDGKDGPSGGWTHKSQALNSRDSYAIPAETATAPVVTDQSTSRPVPEAARLTAAPTISDTAPDIRK